MKDRLIRSYRPGRDANGRTSQRRRITDHTSEMWSSRTEWDGQKERVNRVGCSPLSKAGTAIMRRVQLPRHVECARWR